MQQNDIRLVEREFGAEAYYQDSPMSDGHLLDIKEAVFLIFLLRPTDPLFMNYTDLPIVEAATNIQYFSNTVVGSDAQATSFVAGNNSSIPMLIDEASGEKLVDQAEGWRIGDIAVISIAIGETATNGSSILIDGAIQAGDFTIHFSARRTKWRYHIIDRTGSGYQHFQLLEHGTQQPVPSEDQETKLLPNGSEAIVLSPVELIPLRERPRPRFQLSTQPFPGSHNTPLSIPLPSADANQLSQKYPSVQETVNAIYYSDLYVYL
ncbi:MAG: hypothetical protein AAGF89_11170 [Bacteroidota bacterium]